MPNLHKLTKQLDVLTWNSRSVLNALIRSTMAAGSSNGFTVKRFGNTSIVLSRDDIYRIYNFYEKWESLGYPTDEQFYDLLAAENACYGDGDLVTESLIKHAQVMWLNSTNAKLDASGWIDQIRSVVNPKWFTNTAPIPVNIRTPIYDENLSTKTYDSYETYLFPRGYYALDTLGFQGDGSFHTAGGKRWNFEVDDVFNVISNRILLGTQDDEYIEMHNSLYRDGYPRNSLEGGTNSFAFAYNSISYGDRNLNNGTNSAIVGGRTNMILGGLYNDAIGAGVDNVITTSMSMASGNGNHINTSSGFAANRENHVGAYHYEFTRYVVVNDTNTETECLETIEPVPGCVYHRDTDETAATSSSGANIGSNQIFISVQTVRRSGIGINRISSGSSASNFSSSIFDFKVGDKAMLYGFVIDRNMTRKACSKLLATVVSIDKLATDNSIVSITDSRPAVGYIVTLSSAINQNTIAGLGNYAVQGGWICRVSAASYPNINNKNVLIDQSDLSSEYNAAFGYNNITAGIGQTVVGTSNSELIRPRFIVGSGTSYIKSGSYQRSNSFVSAPDYTYAKTSSYIVTGVSTVTTAKVHGDDGYANNRIYDEDYISSKVEKYEGVYAYSCDSAFNEDTRAVLRVFHQKSLLAIGDNGLVLYEPANDMNYQTRTVWNELYSRKGGLAIHSGAKLLSGQQDVTSDWEEYYKDWVQKSSTPGMDRSVTVWAHDNAGVHGDNLSLHATHYIRMNCAELLISGITRRSLTAQPTATGVEDFVFAQSTKSIDLITNSGHFYATKNSSGISNSDIDFYPLSGNVYSNAYHVLASSKVVNNAATGNVYDVAELILPGDVSSNCNRSLRGTGLMPHPMVCVSQVYTDNTNAANNTNSRQSASSSKGYIVEELAYRSDLIEHGTRACNNIAYSGYGYNTQWTIVDPNSIIPNYNNVHQTDIYLRSLGSASMVQSGVVTPSTSNPYDSVLIMPGTMPNNAGKVTTTFAANQPSPYYLNGIAINPSMYMMGANAHTNLVDSVTYLAYAPHDILDGETQNMDGTSFNNITELKYLTNLGNTADGLIERTLCTSKYSSGVFGIEYPFDLSDVWMVVQRTSSTLAWDRLISNLHIVVSGGIVTVDFTLHTRGLANDSILAAKELNLSNYLVYDDSESTGVDDLLDKSLTICLPLDPTIFNSLIAATNPNTGISSNLYGQLYYTGDANVFASGMLSHTIPAPYKDRTKIGNMSTTYSYYGPHLMLSIAGLSEIQDLAAQYPVHLVGVVQHA